jgi:exonuclease III
MTTQSYNMVQSPSMNAAHAKASPGGDAHQSRPIGVRNVRGLPVQRRFGLKTLVGPDHTARPTRPGPRTRFATVNVGSLTGKTVELVDMMRRRRTLATCVQETKWKGEKAYPLGHGFKLWYCGKSSTRNGVGIIASPEMADCATEVIRTSDRLMAVRFDYKGTEIMLVSAYAPQSGCPDDEKDTFWEEFSDLVRTKRPGELLLVGGDLNGHVGQTNRKYPRQHGGKGYGTANPDGETILEHAEQLDLALCNTFFAKRPSHLVTYSSGGHSSQIDFWAVPCGSLPKVMNCKVIPSDNVTTQHLPLYVDVLLPTKMTKRRVLNMTARIKWWKYKEIDRRIDLRDELTDKLIDSEYWKLDSNDQWKELSSAIRATGKSILGETKPGRKRIDKQTWYWSEPVQSAVRAKKSALKNWKQLNTQSSRDA